jgi:hypothetical protein
MREISYADQHFVTSDLIAERVLRYAKLMGRVGTDDVIGIPAVSDDGTLYQVEVLIGPASQITAVEVQDEPTEFPNEAEIVADLDRRIAGLNPPRPVMAERPVEPGTALDPDYL